MILTVDPLYSLLHPSPLLMTAHSARFYFIAAGFSHEYGRGRDIRSLVYMMSVTAGRCIEKVTRALIEHKPNHIMMPTLEQMQATA